MVKVIACSAEVSGSNHGESYLDLKIGTLLAILSDMWLYGVSCNYPVRCLAVWGKL